MKFECPKCQRHLSGDTSLLQELVTCPDCGEVFQPRRTPPPPTPAPQRSNIVASIGQQIKKAAPGSDSSARQRAISHLTFIRANSCYRMLRSLIDVCFVLCLIVVIGAIVMSFVGMFAIGGGGIPVFGALSAGVMSIFVGLLAIAILIAARQSVLILIDISDSLLHEHSKNA